MFGYNTRTVERYIPIGSPSISENGGEGMIYEPDFWLNPSVVGKGIGGQNQP